METDFIVQKIDLRKHIQTNIKSQIVAWAEFLADADRMVLHAVFLHAQQLRAVAAARRVSVDNLRKQLRRLVEHVNSPEFQFIAKHIELLPPPTQAIARKCILQRQSISEAARELRLAADFVRQHRRMALPMLKVLVMGSDSASLENATRLGGVS